MFLGKSPSSSLFASVEGRAKLPGIRHKNGLGLFQETETIAKMRGLATKPQKHLRHLNGISAIPVRHAFSLPLALAFAARKLPCSAKAFSAGSPRFLNPLPYHPEAINISLPYAHLRPATSILTRPNSFYQPLLNSLELKLRDFARTKDRICLLA